MVRTPRAELSLAEWAVLGLLCESQSHGWNLVRALRPDGEIGNVWSCTRPLVYRAIDVLTDRGLITRRGAAQSARGPSRMLLDATPAGRRALARWLDTPVQHLREVRSELMLKLVLLDRSALDSTGLIQAQRRAFAPLEESLAVRARQSQGFERTLALWRHTSARATLRFLDRLAGRSA